VAGPALLSNASTLPEMPSDDLWAAVGDEGSTSSSEENSVSAPGSSSDEDEEPDLWEAAGAGDDTSSTELASESSDAEGAADSPGNAPPSTWDARAVEDLIAGVNVALMTAMPARPVGEMVRRRWSEGQSDPFATPQALLETVGHDAWVTRDQPRRWSEASKPGTLGADTSRRWSEDSTTSVKSHGLGMLFAPPTQADPPAQYLAPPSSPPRPGRARSVSLPTAAPPGMSMTKRLWQRHYG
jgi:hypothetical protein